jgi:hypothetical protein
MLKAIVLQGVGGLYANLSTFLQIAAVPALLLMVLHVASQVLLWLSLSSPSAFGAVYGILLSPILALLGIAWLRHLLLLPNSRPLWWPRWSKQHLLFAFAWLIVPTLPMWLWTLLNRQLVLLALQAGSPSWQYLSHIGKLIYVYVICISGIGFCALAVGESHSVFQALFRAWRIAWRAAFVMSLVLLPLNVVIFKASEHLTRLTLSPFATWPLRIIPEALFSTLAACLFLGLAMSVWAIVFRRLTDWPSSRHERIATTFD